MRWEAGDDSKGGSTYFTAERAAALKQDLIDAIQERVKRVPNGSRGTVFHGLGSINRLNQQDLVKLRWCLEPLIRACPEKVPGLRCKPAEMQPSKPPDLSSSCRQLCCQ